MMPLLAALALVAEASACTSVLGVTSVPPSDEDSDIPATENSSASDTGVDGGGIDGIAPDDGSDSAFSPGEGRTPQVGPTYACGPADGGLTCTCPAQDFQPAPIDEAGQQQTLVLPPDPATVTPYSNESDFDVLAIGRWQRTAGQAELICEEFGVEFTAYHQLYPVVYADDGSVQVLTALPQGTWSIAFTDGGTPASLLFGMPVSLTITAPTFYDNGQRMYFALDPWPADYIRVP
ncbi:MAG: hypothetical protein ABSC94_12840 [Polyangiaceae bacterium]|jgi:hypothetical protein